MTNKAIDGKAYGSIPHLPGSNIGIGDYSIHVGQARICTEKTRDAQDLVIVQEKLDGACVAVLKTRDGIKAIGRAGYLVETSQHEHMRRFKPWVDQRWEQFDRILGIGEWIVGEWMTMAHGIEYYIDSEDLLFSAFDIYTPIQSTGGKRRLESRKFHDLCDYVGLNRVYDLHRGEALSIDDAMELLNQRSPVSPIRPIYGLPEGLVYRVERNGKVEFLAKFVQRGHIPGKFFEEGPIWNKVGNDDG